MCATCVPEVAALLEKGIELGYPGLAALVQTGNGSVRAAAVGCSDLEHRVTLTVEDAFHMASITKVFTATAVLQLVDQGELTLHMTLSDVLGERVAHIPHADRISVLHLLEHSSGIYATNNDPEYLTTVIGPGADPTRVWTPEELIALADGDRNAPSGMPGDGNHYADTNYVLLGMIVEHVVGRPFKDHVARTLLEPLSMKSTYFYSDYLGVDVRPPVETVRGYLLASEAIRSVIDIHAMFKSVESVTAPECELLDTTLAAERIDAAGGLVCTLPDLFLFASALFRGELLSAASQRFLMKAAEGMETRPVGTTRLRVLQSICTTYGVLAYKEGDGPGGVNTVMAYRPSTDEIFLGFTNIFGYFNEVEFMIENVLSNLVAGVR